MKERLIQMLQSTDKEMVILGMTLCFEQGEQWCRDNLPVDGATALFSHNLLTREIGNFGVRKNNLVIYIGVKYIHCRYVDEYPTRLIGLIDL